MLFRSVDTPENHMCTARQAKEAVNFPASLTTVRRRLRAAGIRSRQTATKPPLSEQIKARRVEFAHRFLLKDAEWRRRIVWTDEKTF